MVGDYPCGVSAGDGLHVLAHHWFVARGCRQDHHIRRTYNGAGAFLRSRACRRSFPLLHQKGPGIQGSGQGRENEVSAEGSCSRRQFSLSGAVFLVLSGTWFMLNAVYVHSSRRSAERQTREQRSRHQRGIGRESGTSDHLCAFRHVGAEDWPPDYPGLNGTGREYRASLPILCAREIRLLEPSASDSARNVVNLCARPAGRSSRVISSNVYSCQGIRVWRWVIARPPSFPDPPSTRWV